MSNFSIAVEFLQIISAEQAFHYRIIPISKESGDVVFITDSPNVASLAEELKIIFGYPFRLQSESAGNISRYLATNYRLAAQNGISDLHHTADFLEKILMNAKQTGSSDIHFEPFESQARVRFRHDGKLREQYHIQADEYPVIVNKIKIRAQLDISEKRLPQDGRITVSTQYEEFDIRVSVLPTLHGEKVVLRILSKDAQHISLEALGMSPGEMAVYTENIRKPTGIVLISGPTGSGKTTTLYATLKTLNLPNTNILTVEDPIEYTLEGINQVQLKENIGLDFASTLRAFLRQDPDIIMVGEIRDVATANMAIRAALTGHLVFSTIHTNSAWATVTRLIDMGIPPFLIAATLNLSVAQRLIRKLCENCKSREQVRAGIFPSGIEVPTDLQHHYVANGCDTCHRTGYSGRKAVYEILPINQELEIFIRNNKQTIDDYCQANNIQTFRSRAFDMIREGTTSVDEVFSMLM